MPLFLFFFLCFFLDLSYNNLHTIHWNQTWETQTVILILWAYIQNPNPDLKQATQSIEDKEIPSSGQLQKLSLWLRANKPHSFNKFKDVTHVLDGTSSNDA